MILITHCGLDTNGQLDIASAGVDVLSLGPPVQIVMHAQI